MELVKIVAALALALGALLTMGYARAKENELPAAAVQTTLTGQEKLAAREAMRRAELVEHQRRKEDFTRRCSKPLMSAPELEACRVAYRRL